MWRPARLPVRVGDRRGVDHADGAGEGEHEQRAEAHTVKHRHQVAKADLHRAASWVVERHFGGAAPVRLGGTAPRCQNAIQAKASSVLLPLALRPIAVIVAGAAVELGIGGVLQAELQVDPGPIQEPSLPNGTQSASTMKALLFGLLLLLPVTSEPPKAGDGYSTGFAGPQVRCQPSVTP